MNSRFRRALCIAAISSSLGACTTVDATRRGAVAYNRAFDDARNQILLLNILRARDSYPQQYSTISTVTGSMRPDMSVVGAFENIVLGAAEVFKPSGTFGFRNPSVTISPLETKEFRAGMVKPISAELVGQLLAQGWTPAVVENLTVAGMAPVEVTGGSKEITLPVADALKLLREGAGTDHTVELLPSATVGADKVRLVVAPKSRSCVAGLPTRSDCALSGQQTVLRSPAGMVQHLARNLRGGVPRDPYFKVLEARARAPSYARVVTQFGRNTYYIAENDHVSMETLSLLAEIIGFQTTDANLSAGKPALTVSP